MALIALRVALSCLVFLSCVCSHECLPPPPCYYLVRVKTGNVQDAGTESDISLMINSSHPGRYFTVYNLQGWGIMDSGHASFERGSLDIFSGTGPCFNGDVCAITLISDGTGQAPGWYLEYVEITIFECYDATKLTFPVNQWLAQGKSYHLHANVNFMLPRLL
ncbi:PLAT domain-containing protein 3-like [Neltuma alba]|uniref:PLAT domain-containing protein 3-like n=1 Tax=Neltuma alba TaxID=207710 RepID=UPI0010A505F1|nr:PLAT domain-containing protein 3-like [Prosopis alba]